MNTETSAQWMQSPARKLTLSDHLPTSTLAAKKSIAESESERQDDALSIIKNSGMELGRTSLDRRVYLETIGSRYGEVNFLARTANLYEISRQFKTGEISLPIDQQDVSIKQAIIADLEDLSDKSDLLFGPVESERFESIIARGYDQASQIIRDESADCELKAAATRFIETFPAANPELVDKHIYTPDQSLLDHWRPFVEKKYADLLVLVDPDKESYVSDEIRSLFEQAIIIMDEKWKLENAREWNVVAGGSNINVSLEEKVVNVPDSITRSNQKMRGLLVHEIGGHLLRNLIGELSGDSLLATDMPGRVDDEEALLTLLEQTLTGTPREAGIPYYLAAGLANGTIGEKIPFEDIGAMIDDYKSVMSHKVQSAAGRAATSSQVHRITRGMPSIVIDGTLHQVTYNADLKYAIGQPHANEYLERNKNNPGALDIAMYGKFAYSNTDHVRYAEDHAPNMSSYSIPTAS